MNLVFENQVTSLGIVEEVITLTLAEQGIQGVPGSSGAGKVSVSFSYGDATPKIIHQASVGQRVFVSQVIVLTAFNAVSTLQLGDLGSLGRFIAAGQINAMEIGVYATNPLYLFSSSTQILLTIAPGSGCTQGSGIIFLEVN